jgi:hypothetical protein
MAPITLAAAHAVFRRWLGQDYDTAALDVVLAAAAVERLDGDPLWVLLVSGAGNAKTETVQALSGCGAFVESTVRSEGALLSGTSLRDQSSSATGGLLRRIGDHGVLVLKDFTTVLAMDRNTRGEVLAALREIYDGRWSRNVGTNGGMTLAWEGRIAFVGAVTTAYDSHHAVVSALGDRFALVRTDSSIGRLAAGRRALGNVGSETVMRAQLADAVAGVIGNLTPAPAHLSDAVAERLLRAADLTTYARTAVERDSHSEVIDAHMPEAPTRFAKMIGQVVRGLMALGASDSHALAVALRVAADSVPPLRLQLLRVLHEKPERTVADLTKEVQKPRNTVRREVDALHALRLVEYREEKYTKTDGSHGARWVYDVAADVDPSVLDVSNFVSRCT